MYIICININVEKEMKKLKDLGFKKVRGTEPGFTMYELNPAELGARQRIHDNLKAEAASSKPQATSRKRQTTRKVKYAS